MPFGMLEKFFHTFVLVENARHRGVMRIAVRVIILNKGRNARKGPDGGTGNHD